MTPQEHIKQLRAALGALHAVQNGSPLPKYDREWKAAMAEAERLLAIEPAEKPKRGKCLMAGVSSPCVPDRCTIYQGMMLRGRTIESCTYWREIEE